VAGQAGPVDGPARPHPGPPKNAKSPKDYWPNQTMVVWPFTDFKDPRWDFGTKYITLHHDAQRGPTKIGLAHQLGWIGYLNQGTLFIKRIPYEEGKTYPDNGCNFETFSNQEMQEIESLGPIVKLAPGKSVEHVERWELIGGLELLEGIKPEDEIDSKIARGLAQLKGGKGIDGEEFFEELRRRGENLKSRRG